MNTQGDYMKKILMIEWKHKKIEDTCDIMVQANSVCVYVYWPAKSYTNTSKCVTIPFSTKTTFHLVAAEEYRHEHVCPVQNKNFEQIAGSGGKCQSSSLHFSSILTTVTIRKKFTACKIGHFGL